MRKDFVIMEENQIKNEKWGKRNAQQHGIPFLFIFYSTNGHLKFTLCNVFDFLMHKFTTKIKSTAKNRSFFFSSEQCINESEVGQFS